MKSHVLRQNRFKGEEGGRPVAEWLNRNRGTKEGDSIVVLVRSLKYLTRRLSLREFLERESLGQSPQYVAELNRANRILRRYPMWAMILGRSTNVGRFRKGVGLFGQFEAVDRLKSKLSWGGNPTVPIVQSLVTLGQAGLLSRLSKCTECQDWFYARFHHQTFCSTRCREKHFRASPSWRASRRKYMRDYRQRERERDGK